MTKILLLDLNILGIICKYMLSINAAENLVNVVNI